jgi:acetyl esterase/lipase
MLIRNYLIKYLIVTGVFFASFSASAQRIDSIPAYKTELNIPYCTVDGKTLIVNAFLPAKNDKPVPAMVEIHGGWWSGGGPSVKVSNIFAKKGIAFFSISYRLGKDGGFPQNIRDCRNAIRFIRKNAARFNIDPKLISCMGGSAGGHLSLMVAMVPEDFDDGGPTEGLKGVSASVCSAFSYIPPTDFVRFWSQGPDDVIINPDGTKTFRDPDPKIPYDSHPRLRILFHGITPDTKSHKALYNRMCPIGHVRKDVPPLLICDGEKDPIVPGLHGKALFEKLQKTGADVTYWMTPNGGHAFPGGNGFQKVLDDFLNRTLKLIP